MPVHEISLSIAYDFKQKSIHPPNAFILVILVQSVFVNFNISIPKAMNQKHELLLCRVIKR